MTLSLFDKLIEAEQRYLPTNIEMDQRRYNFYRELI